MKVARLALVVALGACGRSEPPQRELGPATPPEVIAVPGAAVPQPATRGAAEPAAVMGATPSMSNGDGAAGSVGRGVDGTTPAPVMKPADAVAKGGDAVAKGGDAVAKGGDAVAKGGDAVAKPSDSKPGDTAAKPGDAKPGDTAAKPGDAVTKPGDATPAARPAEPTASAALKDAAKSATNHLQPQQGTLTATPIATTAGAAGTGEIKLVPAKGYKLATNYNIKLYLEAPSGVALDKSFFAAGGRSESRGDAAALGEQALVFAVKATPASAGSYQVHGILAFGICEADSCYPKIQPITIQVAGK